MMLQIKPQKKEGKIVTFPFFIIYYTNSIVLLNDK